MSDYEDEGDYGAYQGSDNEEGDEIVMDEEVEFGEERAAGERTHMRQDDLTEILNVMRGSRGDLGRVQNVMWRKMLTPAEKFSLIVQAYHAYFQDDGLIPAKDMPSWEELANLIAKVDKVNYRNPLAFLLGAYVESKGSSAGALNAAEGVLRWMDAPSDAQTRKKHTPDVTRQDVFRYARYVKALRREV